MSTIERINGKVYFEFRGTMITKTNKGWYTLQGEKFDRKKISNFVRSTAIVNRGEVMQLRSILNRHFNYDLGYVI